MLSIIIPAHNEEKTIAELLFRLTAACPGSEILVVDDHSTDATAKIAQSYAKKIKVAAIKLIKKKGPKGKVTTLLQGFAKAKGEILAMIDADLEYPPEAIPKMVKLIEEGKADIVLGKRHFRGVSPIRQLLSTIYTIFFGNLLLGIPASDIQTGEKVFKKGILSKFKIEARAWGFDSELLFKAHRAGFKIAEVPIIYTQRVAGRSKVGLISTSIDLALTALRLFPFRFR